jgi:Vitamin K-dependent gamma-carboxylase
VLLHMVFMLESQQFGTAKGFKVFLHNLAVAATIVQLCIVYFNAGTMKLQGDVWVNGTALYYVMHVNMYAENWSWLRGLMKNPIAVALGSYTALIYQVGFPFMLTNRFHLPWLTIGLGFHLGIVLLMGLTTFGTVMITLALFTVRDSEWLAIQNLVQQGRQFFSRRHKSVDVSLVSGD